MDAVKAIDVLVSVEAAALDALEQLAAENSDHQVSEKTLAEKLVKHSIAPDQANALVQASLSLLRALLGGLDAESLASSDLESTIQAKKIISDLLGKDDLRSEADNEKLSALCIRLTKSRTFYGLAKSRLVSEASGRVYHSARSISSAVPVFNTSPEYLPAIGFFISHRLRLLTWGTQGFLEDFHVDLTLEQIEDLKGCLERALTKHKHIEEKLGQNPKLPLFKTESVEEKK